VILDLGLPDMDGVEVIRSLRKWTQVPIVILSGRLNSVAKVDALDAGADDYITKPFSVEELLARIRAVTRRTTEPELIEPVRLGRWTVDLSDHVIYETLPANRGASATRLESKKHIAELAHQVHLTPIEWQLLQALVRHPGRLVSQRHLLQEVWGPTYVEQTHYLRQYVKALRHKLEDDPTRPRHLITEPGMGYRFQP
jgi:two-component system, OmpR family, KDP operon response regulator KdpE